MKPYVLVLASLFFTSAHAQIPNTRPQRIKVLSWNIYMLPGFLGVGKTERSDAIGTVLRSGEYDVIVFQEAFFTGARNKIRELLKPVYPFEAGPANARPFSLRTNSGLWIWSKFPIVAQHEIVFRTRYGIDAMSRKGGLLVELDVSGSRIQILATHLQNSGEADLKQLQCVELFTRLLQREQREGVPQLICGDFNVDRYDAPDAYRSMLSRLDACDAELAPGSFTYDRQTNDLGVEPGAKRELIDFIFVRENESSIKRLHYAVKIFKGQWHARHQDLSDHYAIETEVELSVRKPGAGLAANTSSKPSVADSQPVSRK